MLCGLTQPTPADTFLLREKYPKAYQRGYFLFDISSGGSLPHSHSVTLPLVYHRSFEHHWGCREGAAPPSVGGQGTKRFLVNLWILSFHKKVSPGCRGGEPPCKRNRFTESKLRTNNIWDSAPNNTFEKTKVSLCAEAEILQYTRVRNSDQLQAGLHQWRKGAQQRA